MFLAVLLLFILVIVFKVLPALLHNNCKSKVCLVGKTALVTGGSSGIGYQIVLALAQRGCRIIVADKYEDKDLLTNVFKETGSKNVVFKYVDLASFKSVKILAENIIREEEKLDILINNAGIARTISELTEDGLDVVMQVNYFSAFLLTRLLEDLLKKNGGRIIFTGSGLSYMHKFSLNNLKTYSIFSYNNSKICLLMASNIFAERLQKFGVTSNIYHPGIVNTDIFGRAFQSKGAINPNWCFTKLLACWAFFCGKTAEEGAQTAIYLACANEVKDVTGEFFFETKATLKPKLVHDAKFCEAVWEATEEIVKLK